MTILGDAPTVVQMILEAASSWQGKLTGRGTVRIMMAGAPPPKALVARMEEELGWEFIQLYGLTETSPILTTNRSRSEWDHDSAQVRARSLFLAGAPAFGVPVKTAADDEVLARGNMVLDHYWQDGEATVKAIRDRYFHTDDGGEVERDGYLTISDRKKDIIISGGENISSIEVENVLYSHPDVEEAGVFGVPHPHWGETVRALVTPVLGSKVSEQDIIVFCRSRLAHYKCPRSVEFREELPRTATGKLQKFNLRRDYQSRIDSSDGRTPL